MSEKISKKEIKNWIEAYNECRRAGLRAIIDEFFHYVPPKCIFIDMDGKIIEF